MTVQNAYYISAPRRPVRHFHLTTELEPEFGWGVHTVRLNSDPRAQRFEYAASDDQIEALPAFVMEKGETRSVQRIFADMGVPEHEKMAAAEEDGDGAADGLTECAICLSDFEAGDEITLLPCGHFFHLTGCVREWLRDHARTCPTCRADICNRSTGSSDGLGSHSATVATSEEIS
ncbi:unnamed protein product [Chondrus crispus]|uniref:RING-type domain-containing protein n=1 Tax=Chondrus crispus TaxID=2769 RepID=R7QBY7_CHOCR|nr:unnamed protein product [Chondrus crispus]CDF35579.1 unnamed protein product [Chondrus crispus]|eukprot:XP_005715398.1 unnamed protein product [Chondrus crispus]